MPSFKKTDLAVVRQVRELETAAAIAIRAASRLATTMIDAEEARGLDPRLAHPTLLRVGRIINDAIVMRTASLDAHQGLAGIAADIGLPITAWGDSCQEVLVELLMEQSPQPATA